MNRGRLWVLIGGMGWLIFFAATLSVPASTAPELWPQVLSILLGLTLLLAIHAKKFYCSTNSTCSDRCKLKIYIFHFAII